VTIARDASVENEALTGMFELPPTNATNKVFGAVARKMLEQGQAQKELLVRRGLSEKLLDDLGATVDAFDASGILTCWWHGSRRSTWWRDRRRRKCRWSRRRGK
jgi:hypothetical protein